MVSTPREKGTVSQQQSTEFWRPVGFPEKGGGGGVGGEGLLFMIAYYRIARAASSWYPFQASGVSKE